MTGDTYMLTIHQAILVPKLKANLLSTMQMRDNDLCVNDEPKSMVPTPTDDHNAITLPITDPDDDNDPLRIPLAIHGVTTYFPTRKPTAAEYEQSPACLSKELTYEAPDWDPGTTRFAKQEECMVDANGLLLDMPRRNIAAVWTDERRIAALQSIQTLDQDDNDLGKALLNNVNVRLNETAFKPERSSKRSRRAIKSVSSGKRKWAIGPKTLAKNWRISIERARRTIEATTQRGIRTTLHPTLSRRFRTNDRQLRYRRIAHDMFTDTLEAGKQSWFRQNRYAQVFTTSFGWVRVFPMKKKSDAHEGLSLMAQRDGVPHTLIMDGSLEQTKGTFRKKARNMSCHMKQTEPYSPWQNAAESAIGELKRGTTRKGAAMKSPAKLWDHCIELEAYIRSHTALDSYELNGQVPETIVSGQTADISPFIEYGWYDWCKYYDSGQQFPDSMPRALARPFSRHWSGNDL